MAGTALKGAHLSLQQDRLWSFQQESKIYRSQCTVLVKGTLNYQCFQQALWQLVEQHTIFQTVFYPLPGMDIPIQVIGHQVEVSCPIISLGAIAESKQRVLLDMLLVPLREKTFDLAHGPLFRSVLFRLSRESEAGGNSSHILFISLPALCADAATLPLLLADLVKRYHLCLSGQERASDPLQYTAVSVWQKQVLMEEHEGAKIARDFWQRFAWSQIALVQQHLVRAGLVSTHAEGGQQANLQASERSVLEPLSYPLIVQEAVSRGIRALASRSGVSVMAILLACWLVVLWRLTGEAELLIGVACDGRDYEELAEVPGLYTRFVPFLAYTRHDWTFEQFVTFIEHLLEETRQHQAYFSWESVSEVANKTVVPMFPVIFEHESWPASFSAEQLEISLEQRSSCTEPFILKLSSLQVGENLQLELSCDPQFCVPTCIPRLTAILQALLYSVVKQPQGVLSSLTLLTADEQRYLLTTFSAPLRSLPTYGWHRLFEAHVKQRPGQLAVISAQEQLTYQQLNERANQLAHVLRRRGVGPNVLVGLYTTRSAQMLVGLLGVLKAGGAYMPLDMANPSVIAVPSSGSRKDLDSCSLPSGKVYPPNPNGSSGIAVRLSYQLQESQPFLLLAQQAVSIHLQEWRERTLWLEDLAQEMSEASANDLPEESEAGDLVYVIYTSGSTGTPKGVMIQQGSLLNYTQALCDQLGSEPGWQYAMGSTLAADLGNTAIFCALASGGCVQVLDYETVTSVEAMVRWTKQYPIDVLKIVPSHLSALLAEQRGKMLLPRRALVLGGETLPGSLLERLSELGAGYADGCKVFNHYGPTETTVGVLVNALGVLEAIKEQSGKWHNITLGKPIINTQVYVLDQWMQIVPPGVTGELYIGGAGLAMGYMQQPQQTAERFVPHPFVGNAPCASSSPSIGAVPCASPRSGERLYRTGDLARYTEEGNIEFLGRCDNQVKLRGYRIELTEIEAVLRQHPQIRDSAVVLHDDPSSDGPQLVGYIVPRKLPMPTNMNIPDFLYERLPAYMVPSTFVYLKFLPLTANGKVKRDQLTHTYGNNAIIHTRRDSALRLPENSLPLIELDSPSRKIVQPRDAIEWQLLQIWEEVLKIPSQTQPLSILDNFFQFGGHSLSAVRLMSQIAKRFGQDLPLTTLFRYPTVATLAVVLRQHLGFEDHSPLAAIHSQGNHVAEAVARPPFFCVHPAGGTAFCYVNLARRLGPDQPFYGLHMPDLVEETLRTVEEIAAYYIATIRTVQPQGPYLLGGWSAGGVMAYEMAQQLQRQGQEVGVLALLDTSVPSSLKREKALEEVLDLEDTGVVKYLIDHFELTVPDDFEHCKLEERFIYALEQVKRMHHIPEDISIDLVRRYVRTGLLMKRIAHMYIAQTYPNHIDYFASSEHSPASNASLEQTVSLDEKEDAADLHLQRWYELAKGGMEVHPIPGNHQTLIEEPYVQELAKLLKQCINRNLKIFGILP